MANISKPSLEVAVLGTRRVQVCCGKGLVSQVGVVLQGKGKLSVAKVVCGRGAVVEPLEQLPPGEESLVEAAHDLGVGCLERGDVTVAALDAVRLVTECMCADRGRTLGTRALSRAG